MKKIIVAFPLYNEGVLAREFVEALDLCISRLPEYKVSLLVVNDGSTDDTLSHLEQARRAHINDLTIINLSRNTGHSYAVQCLIDHTPGPLTILLDADFQDDPNDIPELLALQEKTGADIVRVARNQQSGGWLHRVLYATFRWIYRKLTKESYAFGTFGLYSTRAIEDLRRFRDEAHRYFPGIVSMVGLKTAVLPLTRSERRSGQSKMGTRRLFRLAFDAFFSFSVLPIRLATALGIIVTILSLAFFVFIACFRFFSAYAIPGWTSIVTAIMFFGGVQLLFLGILGEYVARIFEQVKNRPHYFIESVRTLSAAEPPHALSSR